MKNYSEHPVINKRSVSDPFYWGLRFRAGTESVLGCLLFRSIALIEPGRDRRVAVYRLRGTLN